MKQTCNNTIVMRLTYAIIIIIFFFTFCTLNIIMKPVSTGYLLFLGPKCFLAADILGVNLMVGVNRIHGNNQ